MSKILICVDCQYDFIEGGNLPVAGGQEAMSQLVKHLEEHASDYDAVVCTLDWHPRGHCSFVSSGGTWPVHCVQHTHGAALYQDVVDALHESNIHIYLKGNDMDKDEYSFLDSDANRARFAQLLQDVNPQNIDLCGIAGDVCVMNTARSLMEMGQGEKITLLTPAIASIDPAVTAKFVQENGLKTTI